VNRADAVEVQPRRQRLESVDGVLPRARIVGMGVEKRPMLGGILGTAISQKAA
jgi:hypothetical protein